MSEHPSRERDEQIFDLLDGTLPEADQVELRAWLDMSPKHWQRFAQLSYLHSEIAGQLRSQRSSDGLRLDALQAEPAWPIRREPAHAPNHKDPDALTRQKYVAALMYVLEHTFTPKRIAVMASAAAVLLGAVLALVLLSGPDESESIAQAPESTGPSATTDEQDVSPVSPVARLTAEHDAAWSTPGPSIGEALQPGERLVLTAGFAELTTNRGAVLTIEGPCQIDLADDDDTVRLQRGKLFAAVPPSASGFVVETPTARIVDIGTAFGVEVGRDRATRMQVYKGEVRAAAVDGDGRADGYETFYAEQAAAIDHDAGVKKAAFDPGLYEQGLALMQLRPTYSPRPRKDPQSSGMWWRGEMARHLNKGREKSAALQVFIEKTGVLLQDDVRVDLNDPGSRLPHDDVSNAEHLVEAGKRVDVYLLHFDPKNIGEDWDKGFFKLTFDRPILGIACRGETIAGVDRALGLGPQRYPIVAPDVKGSDGLELDYGDVIKIIPESRALELTAFATTHFDQFLVLVESAEIPLVTESQ